MKALSIQSSETLQWSLLAASPNSSLPPHLDFYLCFLLLAQILPQVYFFKKEKNVIFLSNSEFMNLFLFQVCTPMLSQNFFFLSFLLHYEKALKRLILSNVLPVKDLLFYCRMCFNNIVPIVPHSLS